MIQAKCIEKIRDKNNNIIAYQLIDTNNCKQVVKPLQLKNAIKSGSILVSNLKLTKNNKLIDHDENISDYSPEQLRKILQKYYPWEIHSLKFNDGDVNYDNNGVVYYSADIERNNFKTSTIVEIWVNFRKRTISIQIEDDDIPKREVKAKSFTEKGIADMIKVFLNTVKNI